MLGLLIMLFMISLRQGILPGVAGLLAARGRRPASLAAGEAWA